MANASRSVLVFKALPALHLLLRSQTRLDLFFRVDYLAPRRWCDEKLRQDRCPSNSEFIFEHVDFRAHAVWHSAFG